MKSRTKIIQAGRQQEIEVYPVTNNGRRRDRARKLAPDVQRRYHQKCAEKKLARLINANFTRGDVLITLTYRAELRPALDYAAVLRDIQNYLRRVKNYRQTHEMSVIKYIYTIEHTGKDNWHAHIIMTAIDREIAESLWIYADYVNTKSFQPTAQEGGEAFAKYIAGKKSGKDSQTVGRNWNCSKNLEQPAVTVQDGTYTRRQLARIARERTDDKEYWENKYKTNY